MKGNHRNLLQMKMGDDRIHPAEGASFHWFFLGLFLFLLVMVCLFRILVAYPVPSRKTPVMKGDYFWDSWRVKRYLRSWGIKGTDWVEDGIVPVQCIVCDEVARTCALDLRREEIDHLEWCKGLRISRLDISGTDVTDVGPLACQEVRNLDISNTRVSDLSPLARLPNLYELRLDNTPVSNLVPLAKWAVNTGKAQPLGWVLSFVAVSDVDPMFGLV